jgi:hypothetical protein
MEAHEMIGKEKCDMLKRIRAEIAAENGIEGFEYKKCPYEGSCKGTCPACDAETEELYHALRKAGIKVKLNDKTNTQELCEKAAIIMAKKHRIAMGAPELITSEKEIRRLRGEINNMSTMGILEPDLDCGLEKRESHAKEIEPEEVRLMGEIALDEFYYQQILPEDILEGRIVEPTCTLSSMEKDDCESEISMEPKTGLIERELSMVMERQPDDKNHIHDAKRNPPRGLLSKFKKKKK